jgi:hypothetical protein
MTCRTRGSGKQSTFNAEVAIRLPELESIDRPIVWVFPKLVVCFDCGIVEFVIPDAELHVLEKGKTAASRGDITKRGLGEPSKS